MNYLIPTIGLLTVISTFLGGLFAIKLKDKLHLILGFSAGAVVGVAFFDLIPESIELSSGVFDVSLNTLLMACGFTFLMILDRAFSLHFHQECDCENESHRGTLAATTLVFHSMLDGFGIGLAFQVSNSVGWVVALAVLAHDFSDGINTVSVIFKGAHGAERVGRKSRAMWWLIADALAPAFGIGAAMLFTISAPVLGLILSVFTGFFLYIGASDLIPESHHHHPTLWTTTSTILGIAVLYFVIQIAG